MIPELEFRKIMGVLSIAYPRFELDAATIEVYYRLLGDLDGALVKAATLHLASSGTFFPAASEIRSAAFDLVQRASGVPGAYEAWQEVLRQIGLNGHLRPWEFSHPVIGRAVRAIGGQRAICMSEKQYADRARFIDAFDRMVQRERAEVRMLPEVRAAAARLMASEQLALSRKPGEVGGNGDEQRPAASQGRQDVLGQLAPGRQEGGNGGGKGDDQRPAASQERADVITARGNQGSHVASQERGEVLGQVAPGGGNGGRKGDGQPCPPAGQVRADVITAAAPEPEQE